MGVTGSHPSASLLLAVITRHDAALQWTRERCVEHWGAIDAESPTFRFADTSYYDATMGLDLGKTFLLFAAPFDPARLAAIKHQTNRWEAEYAALGLHTEPRPLNLDPGYLTAAKLVLASTKDHAHRIYLRDGIYAEVTLFYRHGAWQSHEFTFPDYAKPDYHPFFTAGRERLKKRRHEE